MSVHGHPGTDGDQSAAPAPSGDDERAHVGEDGQPPDEPRSSRAPIAWTPMLAKAVRIGGFVVLVSIALGGAAAVAAGFHAEYGAVKNGPNAQAWAALTSRMAGAAICTSCHEPEARAQDASAHVDVSCEGCHGPAAGHASSEVAAREVVLRTPTSLICATCHAGTAGRPSPISQINPADHYSGDQCMRCHDPHSIVAVRPPTVSHPLADLPECTTCHAPDGLKRIPSGHEIVRDEICLSCHRPREEGPS
jgi:Cytochrome c7 and related cytochrome c